MVPILLDYSINSQNHLRIQHCMLNTIQLLDLSNLTYDLSQDDMYHFNIIM